MRQSSATAALLSLLATARTFDVPGAIDSAYLCPTTPFQLLASPASALHGAASSSPTRTPQRAKPRPKRDDYNGHDTESAFQGHFWEVRTSPGKGLGVFAKMDIPRGTRIIVEPSVIELKAPQFSQGQGRALAQLNSAIEKRVRNLAPAKKAEYLSCFDNRKADDKDSREALIFRNNAYPLPDGNLAIFPKAAKINHSCSPNAGSVYSQPARKRIIWAGRDIAAGEEITVTYVPLLESAESRRGNLRRFGFECDCEACQQAAQGSDAKREEIKRLFSLVEAEVVGQSQPAGDVLFRAEDLVRMVKEDGLADYLAKAYHLAAFAAVRLDNPKSAKVWARRELTVHKFADGNSQYAQAVKEFLMGLEKAT